MNYQDIASDLQTKKELYLGSQKKVDRLNEIKGLLRTKEAELASVEKELALNSEELGTRDLCQVREDIAAASRINILVSDIKGKLTDALAWMETLSENQIREEKVFETLSLLLDKTTLRYVKSLEQTLNKVYSSVFQRLDKGVSLKISVMRGKKVLTLSIQKQVSQDTGIDLDLKPGSVTTLLGTILNLYYIIFSNLPRFVIFDESFASLDDIIVERFFQTLKVFVDELGFKFLIISQDPAVSALGTRVYESTVGGGIQLKERAI
jgi:hypothetical protein